MLQFFVGEAHQGFERRLVAQPMVAADLEDLCADVALDEPKDVGIRTALDLAHQPFLVGVEERQAIDFGQPVGQELLRVELASANDIAIDVPANALGHLDAFAVTGMCSRVLHGLHDFLLK